MTLKEARESARYTKRAVAKKLNITEQTLLNWEKGKSKPDVAQFVYLCKIYGVSADDVLQSFYN